MLSALKAKGSILLFLLRATQHFPLGTSGSRILTQELVLLFQGPYTADRVSLHDTAHQV